MTIPRSLHDAVQAVIRQEPMGRDGALVVLALRAILAAIGSDPLYRRRYIAKGGTVLRLRTNEPLECLPTTSFAGRRQLALPVLNLASDN